MNSRFPEVFFGVSIYVGRLVECEILFRNCFLGRGPLRRGGLFLARFARLTLGGKPAGHQLVSPADLSTKVSWLVGYRHLPTYLLVVNPADSQL